MRILSCAQMRQAERYSIDVLKIPGQILMENAGRAVADFVLERFSHDLFEKRIAVVCAKGNNAGDGFVAARRLLGYGALVQVILMCDPADFSPDAAVMYDKLRCAAVTISAEPSDMAESLEQLLADVAGLDGVVKFEILAG